MLEPLTPLPPLSLILSVSRTCLSRIDAASGWRTVNDAGEEYLDARVFPTKPGIFVYRNKDGSLRRELRPRDEVRNALKVAQAQKAPRELQRANGAREDGKPKKTAIHPHARRGW